MLPPKRGGRFSMDAINRTGAAIAAAVENV